MLIEQVLFVIAIKFWSTINLMLVNTTAVAVFTLSRSSRILTNFNFFSASSKFSNIAAFSIYFCSLNCFSCNFNFLNFLLGFIK